jgi:hypothetical protein
MDECAEVDLRDQLPLLDLVQNAKEINTLDLQNKRDIMMNERASSNVTAMATCGTTTILCSVRVVFPSRL